MDHGESRGTVIAGTEPGPGACAKVPSSEVRPSIPPVYAAWSCTQRYAEETVV